MTITATESTALHQLNHAEMVYRPGERALVARVFETLGMRVVDNGGEWLYAFVDPEVEDFRNNACYASQVTPEQWALEQALSATIEMSTSDATATIGSAARGYLGRLKSEPQRSFHLGIRYRDRADFDATLDRIRALEKDAALAGRLSLMRVFHPDEPGALAKTTIQAFVRTDIVAAGLLAFGQHFELQYQLPRD